MGRFGAEVGPRCRGNLRFDEGAARLALAVAHSHDRDTALAIAACAPCDPEQKAPGPSKQSCRTCWTSRYSGLSDLSHGLGNESCRSTTIKDALAARPGLLLTAGIK